MAATACSRQHAGGAGYRACRPAPANPIQAMLERQPVVFYVFPRKETLRALEQRVTGPFEII